jgi:hypothetical protein
MEGFWTVQFQGVQGMGCGVITLIGGQLFGGDSAFLYKGTYTQRGGILTAQVQVKRYAPGMGSVMGRDQFDLQLTGDLQDTSGQLSGAVPGTPLKFNASISKHGELPKA